MGSVEPRERPPLILLGLFIVLLLALDRPLPVPEAVRVRAALAAVLLVPGAGMALLWPGLGRYGWLAVLGLAFPLSLVPVTGATLTGILVGMPALAVAAGYLFGVFLVVLAALVLARRREGGRPPERRFTLACTVLLAAAAALCVWAGAPRGPGTDGPDHITTVNEILQTGQFLPHQGLVPAEDLGRTDPRKGVFHVGLALAAALAGVSASSVWAAAPSILVPSWLALMLLLGLRLGTGRWGALLAAALALLVVGGAGGPWAPRIGYGAHVGIVVGWAATWVLLTYARRGGPALVALVALLAAVSGAVHPLAPAFFFLPAVVMGVFGGRRPFVPRARWWGALAAALLAAAPVLLFRLLEVRGPVNPLHEQVMPVLELGKWGSVLWPSAWLGILGWPGLAGLLLVPFARPAFSDRTGWAYVVASLAVSLGIVWIPGVFDLAAGLASSLPIKLLYMTPYFWVLGAVFTSPWKGGRTVPRIAAALILLLALPAALARFAPERVAGWRPAGIDAMLTELRAWPRPTVVAADPWVSSLVAAETQHRPITVLHQHGHPLDPRGLDRLEDLGAILSPWIAPDDALPVLTRYRAGLLLVPDPGTRPEGTPAAPYRHVLGAAAGGILDRLRAEKFAVRPESYPVVRRTPGWTLITPQRGADTPNPAPLLRAGRDPVRGSPVAARDGRAGGVRLLAVEHPEAARPGGPLILVCWWKREAEEAVRPVETHFRVTRLDGGEVPKPVARIRAALSRDDLPLRRYREVTRPFLGAWPPTAWPEGAARADTVALELPAGLEPGSYVLTARVLEQTMFPVIGLRDLWREDDRWEGAPVDTLVLEEGGR